MAESRQVSRVFHPAPASELVALANGSNAQVLVGDPAYQLTTGELVIL